MTMELLTCIIFRALHFQKIRQRQLDCTNNPAGTWPEGMVFDFEGDRR